MELRTLTGRGRPLLERWHVLRISELMMLVAAVSFLLAALRPAGTVGGPAARWYEFFSALIPTLSAATLLVFLLSLRPPRPAWYDGIKEPGRLACGIASIILVAVALGALAGHLLGPLVGMPPAPGASRLLDELAESLELWGHLIGASVLLAWFVLAYRRQWTAEPTTVGQLGRLCGAAWIVVGPAVVGLWLFGMLGTFF